jgi:hypothetical protein
MHSGDRLPVARPLDLVFVPDLWDFFDLFLVFVPDLPHLVFIFVPSCMYLTDLTDLGHSCMDLCDSCMIPFEIM